MKPKVEKTWKNVFIVFQYSQIMVQLAVPDDEDEYDYDVMMQEASEIIAEDLGIPVSHLPGSAQEVVVQSW